MASSWHTWHIDRRPVACLVGFLLLGLAGCSGSDSGVEPTPGPTPDGGTADSDAWVEKDDGASVDVSTEPDTGIPQSPCQGLDGHFTISLKGEGKFPGTTFALDLTSSGASCEARVTPEWYPAVKLIAQLTASSVVLDDSSGPSLPTVATGTYTGPKSYTEVHFLRLELPRNAGGQLAGTVVASVNACKAEDDTGNGYKGDFVGTVLAATPSPKLYAGPPRWLPLTRPSPGDGCGAFQAHGLQPYGGARRPFLPDKLLPWDVVAVEASQPLPGLASRCSVAMQDGGAGTTGPWVDAPLDGQATAQDVWAWSRFLDWDQVSGTTQPIVIAGSPGDDGGVPVPGQTLQAQVLDAGSAAAEHDLTTSFDGLTFGDVALSATGASLTAFCGQPGVGIAGRLQTQGKTKVLARVRRGTYMQMSLRFTGHSGKEYPLDPELLKPGEWIDLSVPIQDEPELGFSIAGFAACAVVGLGGSAISDVSRVWAE